MGVQPAWWERVWLEPDLLTMQMNCPGIFLFVVMLQAGKTLSVYLLNSSPFLSSPSQEAKSLCLHWVLPPLALALMAKTGSSKPSVAGDTNPPLPSPAIQHLLLLQQPQGGCQTASEQLWSLLQGSCFCISQVLSSLLLGVSGTECDTLMLQQTLNFRIWSPETQAIPPSVLQSSFICVSDYSYSFHRLFLLSCSQSMSDVTLLPSMILWHQQILLKSCCWQVGTEPKEQEYTNILPETWSIPYNLNW